MVRVAMPTTTFGRLGGRVKDVDTVLVGDQSICIRETLGKAGGRR